MWSSIIDAILIINLDQDKERWEKIYRSFSDLGLEEKIHRISAVKGSDLPGYKQLPWFTKRTEPRSKKVAGTAGCVLSHANAIRFALQHPEWKRVLILEDDAFPDREKLEESSEMLESFTNDHSWDMIYFGHTGTSRHSAVSVISETGKNMIVRTDGVLGTFAMLIHRQAWGRISDSLPTEKTVWPWIAMHKAVDYWFKKHFSPFARTYVLSPDPILHTDGISSISNELATSPPEEIHPDMLPLSDQELNTMLNRKAPLEKLNIWIDSASRFLNCRFRGFSPGSSVPPLDPQRKLTLAHLDTYSTATMGPFLHKHFPNIEFIDDYKNADYVIYGDFGFNHPSCQGIKIFLTGENHQPNLRACDYALTHEREETSRCFRLPCWLQSILNDRTMREYFESPRIPLTREDLAKHPRRFCNFVYKNKVCKKRNRFFHRLSRYKKVDSAGMLFNNTDELEGTRGDDSAKLKFLAKYKFTIAFENESHPGYQTEKLMHPLAARTVPIYWGNPYFAEDFNPKAFIAYSDYPNEQALIDHIRKLDENDDLLLEYLNQPVFTDNVIGKTEERLVKWFECVFSSQKHRRSRKDKIMFWVSQFYGHAAPYHFRRFMRYLRGKK